MSERVAAQKATDERSRPLAWSSIRTTTNGKDEEKEKKRAREKGREMEEVGCSVCVCVCAHYYVCECVRSSLKKFRARKYVEH